MEVQHEAPHGDLNCSDQLQGLVHRKGGPMGSRTAVVGFRPPGAPSTPWRTQPQWSASGPRPHKAPLGESNRSGRLQALGPTSICKEMLLCHMTVSSRLRRSHITGLIAQLVRAYG